MERSAINSEKLIREVYKHRSLWDQKSVDYLSRTLKSKEWEAVAHDLECRVEEVKNRWKILKDSFNREVRNMAKNGNPTSKWAHFDQMSFLLKGSNSLLLPSAYLSQSMIELDSQNNTSGSCDNEFSENSLASREEDTESVSFQRKKVKIYHNQPNSGSDILSSTPCQPNLPVDWNESNGCRHEHGNEDYYFLLSLLPSFERMTARQKMRVKIKMMQDVYDAAFGDSASDLSRSRSSMMDNCLNAVSSGS